MKKLLSIIMALALLSCLFALPGRAAGEALAVAFATAVADLPRNTPFTVEVKITPTGAGASALRLYVLYDSACFEWLPAATARFGLVNTGMFAQKNSADAKKYPAGMPAAERAKYSVIVLQWCAVPAAGALPAIPAGAQTHALSLGFQVKADAPYPRPGGKIFVSTDYSLADTPWFYAEGLAIDTAPAQLLVQPMPPDAALLTGLAVSGGFVSGFPASMPRVGGASPWSDSGLGLYFSATNDGVVKLARPAGYPLTGTGTALQVWNANETRLCEEYTLVVFGDVDGNFVIDFDDWAALKAMATGPVGSDPYRMAADIDRNGTVDAADLALLLAAARGAGTIAQ